MMNRNEIDQALQLDERDTFVSHHRYALSALLRQGREKVAPRRAAKFAGDGDGRYPKSRPEAQSLRVARA